MVEAKGYGFKYRPGDSVLTEGSCNSHSALANAAGVPQIRARPLLYTNVEFIIH